MMSSHDFDSACGTTHDHDNHPAANEQVEYAAAEAVTTSPVLVSGGQGQGQDAGARTNICAPAAVRVPVRWTSLFLQALNEADKDLLHPARKIMLPDQPKIRQADCHVEVDPGGTSRTTTEKTNSNSLGRCGARPLPLTPDENHKSYYQFQKFHLESKLYSSNVLKKSRYVRCGSFCSSGSTTNNAEVEGAPEDPRRQAAVDLDLGECEATRDRLILLSLDGGKRLAAELEEVRSTSVPLNVELHAVNIWPQTTDPEEPRPAGVLDRFLQNYGSLFSKSERTKVKELKPKTREDERRRDHLYVDDDDHSEDSTIAPLSPPKTAPAVADAANTTRRDCEDGDVETTTNNMFAGGNLNLLVPRGRKDSTCNNDLLDKIKVYFNVAWDEAGPGADPDIIKPGDDHQLPQQTQDTGAASSFSLPPFAECLLPVRARRDDARMSPLSFTYAELFAGIGGFRVALDALGGECVLAAEIDKDCRDVYGTIFHEHEEESSDAGGGKNAAALKMNGHQTTSTASQSQTINFPTDVREIPHLPENTDLLVGGFPCQPFSRLGEQHGIAEEARRGRPTRSKNFGGEDKNGEGAHHDSTKRGELYLEIVRLLQKEIDEEAAVPHNTTTGSTSDTEDAIRMNEKRRRRLAPTVKAFILENVPGLLETNNGADFEEIKSAFECNGLYNVSCKVLDAKHLTAQRRRRLFFVGIAIANEDFFRAGDKVATCDGISAGLHPAREIDMSGGSSCTMLIGKNQGRPTNVFKFPNLEEIFENETRSFLSLSQVIDHGEDGKKLTDDPMEELPGDAVPSRRHLQAESLSNAQLRALMQTAAWKRDFRNLLLFVPSETTYFPSPPPAFYHTKAAPLVSHYGHHCSNGNSQLVAQNLPNNPRLFTVEECLQLMGFPKWYQKRFLSAVILEKTQTSSDGEYASGGEDVLAAPEVVGELHVQDAKRRRMCYRMIGNAVAPPVIAAIAEQVLEFAGIACRQGAGTSGTPAPQEQTNDASHRKFHMTRLLALDAVRRL
ncbi:unnamed protein product [Amoebophrya sp. A120]|nr:unnamed protein product [Amoebophrya sp. A120]|eukprot:GSA120T00014006001.1